MANPAILIYSKSRPGLRKIRSKYRWQPSPHQTALFLIGTAGLRKSILNRFLSSFRPLDLPFYFYRKNDQPFAGMAYFPALISQCAGGKFQSPLLEQDVEP
jgi:hypothetical protein